MTSMLPPTRDLPPGRQSQIRGELERAVTGRRTMRLVVPILAGVTAMAAVAVSVVLLQPTPTPPPEPAVQITSSPPPTTPSPRLDVPPEQVAAIEEGCAKSAGVGKAKLYQLLTEQTRWALLYTDREELTCTIGVGGMEYNSGFGGIAVKWLPGHFSFDSSSARSGGDGGKAAYRDVPGFRTAVGRISADVARVTVTVDGRTVDAKIANGTFAARIYYPPTWTIPRENTDVVVQAYDGAGNLLGTGADLRKTCFYDPESLTVIYGALSKPYTECQPAKPWR